MLALAALVTLYLMTGCKQAATDAPQRTQQPSPNAAIAPPVTESATPAPASSAPAAASHAAPTMDEVIAAKKAGTRKAVITTEKGTMVAELYGADEPLTVANFIKPGQVAFL